MNIETILVHVDDGPTASHGLEAAMALCEQHEARLIGLFPYREIDMPGYAEAALPRDLLDTQRDALMKSVAAAKRSFIKATGKRGLEAEWRSEEGLSVEILDRHARYADLVVCVQEDPESGWPEDTVVSELVVRSATPVLVVPHIGLQRPMGRNVYVLWDASREAARATRDSLPLLARADTVKVIAVNPRQAGDAHGEIPCADICLHLARHGVNAEAVTFHAKDVDVGNQVLSRAADDGIDLIVMGAYGHSRIRELVLGGVTRTMLRHMTVPVLMSH